MHMQSGVTGAGKLNIWRVFPDMSLSIYRSLTAAIEDRVELMERDLNVECPAGDR